MRFLRMPSSFSMRCSSMERFNTPETGLLISCATLADSCPSEARRSLCNSFFCAALSCCVRSSTLVSRFWVNWLISPSASPQAVAHHIEGARQFVEFLAAAHDVERLVEFHLAHRLGAFDQLVDRPAEEAAREVDDEQADQRDFDRGDQQDAELHGRTLRGPRFPGSAGGPARRALSSRRDERGTAPGCTRVRCRSAWPWPSRRPPLAPRKMRTRVGRSGGLASGSVLGSTGLVLRIGGEHHLAGAIEHAYAVDPLFERDGLHHLIGGLRDGRPTWRAMLRW